MSQREKTLADSLHIANYTVYLLTSTAGISSQGFGNRYDYIIDNNLASFACCKYHFYRMVDNYLWCLRPGGMF